MSNFFKNLFENYEEQPSPDMWDKIASDVRHHNNIVKARKIGLAVSFVLAGGVAALLLINNNSGASPQTDTQVAKEIAATPTMEPAYDDTALETTAQQDKKQASAPASTNAVKVVAPVENNVATAEKQSSASTTLTEKSVIEAFGYRQNTSDLLAEQPSKAEVAKELGHSAAALSEKESQPTAQLDFSEKMSSGVNPDTATVADNDVKIVIPTAFTPDQSENNRFYVSCSHPESVLAFELSVYTRNGLQVFHTKDINERWDGRYKGRVQPMGAYAYILVYTTAAEKNGQRRVQKGTVTIIR